MALILLPVYRRSLTKFISTFLRILDPFDDNINFHKMIALAIAIGVFLHTAMHGTCDFPRLTKCPNQKFISILGPKFNMQQPTYVDLLDSIQGTTGIFMILIMAFSFTEAKQYSFRRNVIKLPWPFHHLAGFSAFWYAHHLLVIAYTLLIIHACFLITTKDWRAKTTWMYAAVPILLYACERTLTSIHDHNHHVSIIKKTISTYPLSMDLAGYNFHRKCPSATHEQAIWIQHLGMTISVHIRTLGDWTTERKNKFAEVSEPPAPQQQKRGGSVRMQTKAFDQSEPRRRVLHNEADFHDSSSKDLMEHQFRNTRSLGIGATPMISILKDLLNHIKQNKANGVNMKTLVS
ncbi:Ferric reductase transmembrane component-like domain, partial [Dillenia turbinata]